ncbi:OsmC family protein [Pseudalkalibacillus caeni]|nr:OsmC family protein [Pseudalkalibacillus caeni]
MNKDTGFIGDLEHGFLNISSDSSNGYKPFELIVSSIAGCSGSVLRTILEKKRIDFSGIKINAEVTRDKKRANRISEISLHYIVEGSNAEKDIVQKSLELAIKNCGMIQTVIDSVQIKETIEVTKKD